MQHEVYNFAVPVPFLGSEAHDSRLSRPITSGCRGRLRRGEISVERRSHAGTAIRLPASEVPYSMNTRQHLDLMAESLVTLRHARVFITSREKMHATGIELYDQLVRDLEFALKSPGPEMPSEGKDVDA